MPRSNGIYSPPPGTGGTPQTVISSAMFNAWVADISADQNNPRPIIAGGTGAATAADARANLGLGDSATRNVGTTAGTVAAGDDSRFINNPYGRSNILGTVSQSGGIPTGAIIERGSNANGEYVRFADGTQICYRAIGVANINTPAGALFGSDANGTLWTFPAVFGGDEPPSVSGSTNSFNFLVGTHSDFSSGMFRVFLYQASSSTIPVRLMAIGRWF